MDENIDKPQTAALKLNSTLRPILNQMKGYPDEQERI